MRMTKRIRGHDRTIGAWECSSLKCGRANSFREAGQMSLKVAAFAV
jgi:hypothetical protein